MPRGIPNRPDSLEARADEVRRERRKKPGSTGLPGLKLSLDEEKLDRNTYHYRFVAARGGRIQQLTANDYDIAPEGAKDDGNGLGSVTSALGGVGEDGKPYDMVLMRKHKDWFDADQKEKHDRLNQIDDDIRRGLKDNELKGPGVYTPGGGNSIERA